MTSGQPSSTRWLRLAVAGAILASGAYVAQIVAGADVPTWVAITLTAVGGLATAVVIVLSARQAAQEAQQRRRADTAAGNARALAAREVVRFQDALNDLFLPFSAILSRSVTVTTSDRPALQADAKRAVVSYVAKFVGAERARACFFELSNEGSVRILRCNNIYHGRSGAPVTEFRSTNPYHARVFEQLDKRKSEYWPDLEIDRPQAFLRDKDYQTFISATVATDARVYGLLTVDALAPGDLKPENEPFVRLFAQLLAVAIKGNGRNT